MKRRAGFTLIELLVVVAIIGILAAFLLPSLASAKLTAHRAEIKVTVNLVSQAVAAYEGDTGAYPPDRGDNDSDGNNPTPTVNKPNLGALNNNADSDYRDDNLLRHLDGDTENDDTGNAQELVSAVPLDNYLDAKIDDVDDTNIAKPRIGTRFHARGANDANDSTIKYNELQSERRTQGLNKRADDPRDAYVFFDSFQLFCEAEDIQEKNPKRWITNFRD